ncbi:CPBP family intramembrane glutamic endopeptidase [Bacillus sp. B1-b2]|uniref:CPBP family intramembrane glutamic endopeptidase n=1 Tax=Bacillus sp. B1-b2 TaxID=2653201 RepID=UPI001261704C|nr:CPBP family intramembrane glutamic endopeptidase [Bacillus sp. B1-b2]KAB7664897.1 CPBP family intramembrane metalloprotease [Bacillus sp. B1-b2]
MFKNEAGQIRSGWLIGLAIFSSVLIQNIFVLPGYLYAVVEEMTNNPNGIDVDNMMTLLDDRPWLYALTNVLGYIAGITTLLLLWKFVNKKKVKQLGFSNTTKNLLVGLVVGAISIVLIFFILYVTNNLQLVNSFTKPQFSNYTLAFFLFFIFVGISEELTFRGYIMSTLADRGNSKKVIYIVSALVFGIAHIANPNVAVLGIVNIFLVGILFSYMYEKTQSLWMPIGYHITWNYFQGNVFGFPVSGTTPHGIYMVDVSKGNDLLTGGSFGLEGGILATLMIALGYVFTYMFTRNKVA